MDDLQDADAGLVLVEAVQDDLGLAVVAAELKIKDNALLLFIPLVLQPQRGVCAFAIGLKQSRTV